MNYNIIDIISCSPFLCPLHKLQRQYTCSYILSLKQKHTNHDLNGQHHIRRDSWLFALLLVVNCMILFQPYKIHTFMEWVLILYISCRWILWGEIIDRKDTDIDNMQLISTRNCRSFCKKGRFIGVIKSRFLK